MKYIRQFLIIIAISFVGEVLSRLIPMPIPASIYGLIILFIGLQTKLIPYESVKDTGHFLVAVMPIMFIPAAVGLIDLWDIIRDSWIKYTFIMVITTLIVMVTAGRVTQYFVTRSENSHG